MTAESIPANSCAGRSRTMVFCDLCQEPVPGVPLYCPAGCQVVSCPRCGLVFVPPASVAPQRLAEFYSEKYFEGGMADGYADYSASEATLRQQARRTLRIIRSYQHGGNLLEIGCAYGFFLLEAKEWYESQGIEISSFAARQAQQRQLRVVCGDFLQTPFTAKQFEVVCLFDCIEHLADPFSYLMKTAEVLTPAGIVVLTTGDIGSLYARVARQHWRLMTPPQHLFYFSRRTLSRMLEKTGFEVVRVCYPWKVVPWRLVLYQISPWIKSLLGPLGRLPLGLYVNLFDEIGRAHV